MYHGKTRIKWQTTLSKTLTLSWPRLNFDSNTLKDRQTNSLHSKFVAQYRTILINSYIVPFCSNIFQTTKSKFYRKSSLFISFSVCVWGVGGCLKCQLNTFKFSRRSLFFFIGEGMGSKMFALNVISELQILPHSPTKI